MSKWLENFAFRTDIGIRTFILSGLMAFFIALVTVSYKSIKAARANPVEALRYE
jgi:putative ABC transport system permease protein